MNGLWTGKEPPFVKVGVIRNTNFTKGWYLDYSDIAYLDVEEKQYGKRKLQYGDIILEKSGGWPKQPVGRVVIFDKKEWEFSFSNFTSVLRIKNSEEVYFQYLHRFLHLLYISWVTEKMQSHSTGIRNLVFSDYKELQIPLPPLSTQEEIVAKLDVALASIDEAKTKTQQAIIATRELWESTLEESFGGDGWEEKKLWEVLNFHNWFAFKSGNVIEKSNTQLIRMGNLYGNKLDLDRRAVFYPDEFAKQYAKYLLAPNDLIISLTWTTGKEDYWYTVRIPETKYNLLLNQRIAKIVILDENKTLKTFILYFLLSRVFLDNLYRTANWTRQANLSTNTMKEMIFPFPPLKEQSRIVAHLDAVRAETDKLASLYEQKLADLDELRRSVLQEAFR